MRASEAILGRLTASPEEMATLEAELEAVRRDEARLALLVELLRGRVGRPPDTGAAQPAARPRQPGGLRPLPEGWQAGRGREAAGVAGVAEGEATPRQRPPGAKRPGPPPSEATEGLRRAAALAILRAGESLGDHTLAACCDAPASRVKASLERCPEDFVQRKDFSWDLTPAGRERYRPGLAEGNGHTPAPAGRPA